MKATPKSTKTTTAGKQPIEEFFPLYTRSAERLAEFQKKALETLAQQNSDWLETWKKTASLFPQFPGTFAFDLFAQSFDRFVETQKGAIDMAVEQSKQTLNLAKERGASYGKATDGFTGLLQQTVEQTIAAQKKALDFYSEQQKTAFDAVKKQFRFVNNPAAEAFQNGLDTLLETQKAMLDIASKPLHTVQ
jgi:hypothetical protein